MNYDFRGVGSPFMHLQKEMERMRLSLQPPSFAIYDQIEQALQPIRQHHLEIARMATFSDIASAQIREIVSANQHWQDMIDEATASTRVLADLNRTHESWIKGILPMRDQVAQLQAQAKLTLGGVAHQLTVSERLLAGIDFEKIREAVLPQESVIAKLQGAIAGMTAHYGGLAESIRSYPDFTHLPSFAVPGATREVFVTGFALDILQAPTDERAEDDASQLIVEAEEQTSICVSLLQKVDPALATPYAGARAALRGGNPDRARHVLSSLREFWNHLLWQLAPDALVLAWVPQDRMDLIHKGRPTRGARVLYICRNLNHAPLSDFVVQDTRALVKLVEFFNHVHQLESELTDAQLRALLLRTDSWLTYILSIWEGSE